MTGSDAVSQYDVFISYSTQDRDWVRGELLQRLSDAKLRVCIDYRDFERGAPTVEEVERAAKQSRKTVLVLTPNYLQSDWVKFERYLLQTEDPVNKQRRILPLLKESCDLPTSIGFLTYIDFTEAGDIILAWTQLLTALGKPPEVAADNVETPRQWFLAHPYGMPPNFTGRSQELGQLNQWLNGELTPSLFILRALGGFGKSALTWQWLTQELDPGQWPQVVWWSFYEESANFGNFLRLTLAYLTRCEPESLDRVPPRQQLERLLVLLQQRAVLLVLDGFERELRAYSSMGAAYQGDELPSPSSSLPREGSGDDGCDCISPLAEDFLRQLASQPQVKGKVLMSTRLRPRAVEVDGGLLLQGCQEEELTQLQPQDAVAYFRVQGIRGSRVEIEQACGNYGFHPLSLRLLAGYIIHDFEYPGDIRAAESLDLSGDLVQRRNHVLARSYENLSAAGRQLLGRMACFRSPVAYDVLEAVQSSETNNAEGSPLDPPLKRGVRDVLRDLVNRGLVQFDRQSKRFDLHPIVRRYAYDRMTQADRVTAHGQLRDYFAAVPEPERVKTLDDLAPVIELYHHMVRAEQYDQARKLFQYRLSTLLYYQLGAYQVQIELLRALFPNGEDQQPKLQDKFSQGWTLAALANSYSLIGQPAKAVSLFEREIALFKEYGNKRNLAISFGNLAHMAQLPIGALYAAEANLRCSIELEYEYAEAVWHVELGRLLAYRGAWEEAEVEFITATNLNEKEDAIEGQVITWAYRALSTLLQIRTGDNSVAATALTAAIQSFKLAEKFAETNYPVERFYVQSYWLIGAAYRVNGNLSQSDAYLSDALTRCRTINLVEFEADILLDLSRLRADQAQPNAALQLVNEALIITERSGYVLQGADVQLFLAQQALAQGNQVQALTHAHAARQLATCDGGDYVYRVAYDEAGILLQELQR